MKKIWNKDMVDYMVDGLPVYKEIATYKDTRQNLNYRNHIEIVKKYEQAKKDSDEIKENFDLMKYILWKNKYGKTSLLYNPGKYPNWYYYKDQEFIGAIEELDFILYRIVFNLYGIKKINIYNPDDSLLEERLYCIPEQLNLILGDCLGTYIVVNGKRVNLINIPNVKSEYFNEDYELYKLMLERKM